MIDYFRFSIDLNRSTCYHATRIQAGLRPRKRGLKRLRIHRETRLDRKNPGRENSGDLSVFCFTDTKRRTNLD